MGPQDDPCEIMTIRIPKASLFGKSGAYAHRHIYIYIYIFIEIMEEMGFYPYFLKYLTICLCFETI